LCHPCSQFTYYFSSHSSLLVQLVMTPFIASLSFLNFTPCCMVTFLISTISCLWDSCSYCAFITLLSQSWFLALVQISSALTELLSLPITSTLVQKTWSVFLLSTCQISPMWVSIYTFILFFQYTI
jgi:hypothetical protein